MKVMYQDILILTLIVKARTIVVKLWTITMTKAGSAVSRTNPHLQGAREKTVSVILNHDIFVKIFTTIYYWYFIQVLILWYKNQPAPTATQVYTFILGHYVFQLLYLSFFCSDDASICSSSSKRTKFNRSSSVEGLDEDRIEGLQLDQQKYPPQHKPNDSQGLIVLHILFFFISWYFLNWQIFMLTKKGLITLKKSWPLNLIR